MKMVRRPDRHPLRSMGWISRSRNGDVAAVPFFILFFIFCFLIFWDEEDGVNGLMEVMVV